MSVYKPAKSRFYQFDFVIAGRRYHGSTGQTARRAAEAYEERQRRAAAEGTLGEAAQLTLDIAGGKWWKEHGQHRGDSEQQLTRLKRLVKLFPRDIRLAEIDNAAIANAIQKRRGLTFRRSNAEGANEYTVANSTVNRDVIQTLRPILRRAGRIWGARGLPQIAWDELALDSPRPTVRVYSKDELTAWEAENVMGRKEACSRALSAMIGKNICGVGASQALMKQGVPIVSTRATNRRRRDGSMCLSWFLLI